MAPIIVVLFFPTVWKVSVFGVFSVHIFPQLDSLYLVRMGENMDQKNSEYRQLLHSVYNKKRCSKSDRALECMQLYCIFFSFFRSCKIWLNQENAFTLTFIYPFFLCKVNWLLILLDKYINTTNWEKCKYPMCHLFPMIYQYTLINNILKHMNFLYHHWQLMTESKIVKKVTNHC